MVSIILAAAAAPAAFAAPSSSSIAWDGKNGVPPVGICGVANGAPVDGSYLLWVLTANKTTAATIAFGAGGPVAMTRTGTTSTFKYVQTDPPSFAALRSTGVTATYNASRDKNARLVIGQGCGQPLVAFPLEAGDPGSYFLSQAAVSTVSGVTGSFYDTIPDGWSEYGGNATDGFVYFQRFFSTTNYPSVSITTAATGLTITSASMLQGHNGNYCMTSSGYTVVLQTSADGSTWTSAGSYFMSPPLGGTVSVAMSLVVPPNSTRYVRWVPSGLGCGGTDTNTDYYQLDDMTFLGF